MLEKKESRSVFKFQLFQACVCDLFSQVNRRTIAELRAELDSRKAEHAKLVEELSEEWESKLREAREDYQRLVVSGVNTV